MSEELEKDQIEGMLKICDAEMRKFRQFCCSICHKMWRRNGVRKLDDNVKESLKSNKNTSADKVVEECLKYKPIIDEKLGEWICHTCLSNLKKGKMPAQAIANNLELKPLPSVIEDANELETRLVSPVIPFSKIVSLKGQAYQGVKGESVCIPVEPDKVAKKITKLPRKLSDAELVPLKLKRRLRFHGYYMFQVIRRHKVENIFHWLVRNNPLFKKNIAFNREWYNVCSGKNYENYQKLITETDEVPSVEEENSSDETFPDKDNSKSDQQNEDEVDAKNLLYDSLLVDDTPNLPPVREDRQSFSIAPGEGQQPISKRLKNLDQLAFPGIFAHGECSRDEERRVKLSTKKFYSSLVQRQDSRCTKSEFIFHALGEVENEQLQSSINFQSRKGFGGDLGSRKGIEEAIGGNKAWAAFSQVRTTPGAYATMMKDTLAMVSQRGNFSFFQSYSANELNWVTPIKQVAAHEGVQFSDEEILAMPYLEKIKWINKNPASVTIYIYDVFRRFMFDFIMKTKVFGKVKDYVVKVEFQQRGTPHIHLILWVEDAPVYGVDDNEKVIEFIDKHITCAVPSDQKDPLYGLVTSCQTHRCLKNKCNSKKHVSCKYDFPRLPSDSTCISKGQDCEEYQELSTDIKKRIGENFGTVKKILKEKGKEFANLDDLLTSLGISREEYRLVCEFGYREPTIIYRRKPHECWINCYNPYTLWLLQSNQDVAFVLSMYGCICYLLSYLCKPERNVSKLMKEAMMQENQEAGSLLSTMKKIWMNKRELGYCAALLHLLSYPLFWKSREVIYLNADYPENRVRLIKPPSEPSVDDRDAPVSEDPFFDGIIERYQARPYHLENIPLAQFAAEYTKRQRIKNEDDEDLSEHNCQSAFQNKITLLHGKGHMNKKLKKNVIRLPKLTRGDDPNELERFCHSKLMAYAPGWREERLADIMKPFNSYEECFRHYATEIEPVMQEYEKGAEDIRLALEQISEREPDLDKERTDIEKIEDTEDTEVISCFPCEADLEDGSKDNTFHDCLPQRSSLDETIRQNKKYYENVRGLNKEQARIFWYVHDWCKKKILDPLHPPLRLGIMGGAGTGKTRIIDVLYELFERELHQPGDTNDGPTCAKISFTGMAAANIDGRTFHSFLSAKRSQNFENYTMSEVSKATARDRLGGYQVIIEDEMSLQSSNMNSYMNIMFNDVFQVPESEKEKTLYNNVSVIKVGDFMQLNPTGGTPLFINRSTPKNPYFILQPNIWQHHFKCFELKECMRQRGDQHFIKILRTARYMTINNRGDLNKLSEEEKAVIDFFRSRVLQSNHPNYPIQL